MKPSNDRDHIFDLERQDIIDRIKGWGEPSYRARQVWDGLYKQYWSHPSQFTNLPLHFHQTLKKEFIFQSLVPDTILDSIDGKTTKTLFTTLDGLGIEAVLMRYTKRNTVCISTQAGCAMGCTFCATGQMGFKRNLSIGEIVEQVLHYSSLLKREGKKVTNIVLMGMGEPFHNYDASLGAIDRLNDHVGFNLGARRFTISTVGIIPAIRRFTAEKRQVNLAISLHATEDKLRTSMIPVNSKYPIGELMNACRQYVDETGRRITIEWALIQGVNDSTAQAKKLADLLDGLLCHVNVIPLNPTPDFSGEQSTHESVEQFRAALESRGVACTVRIRRGIEIHAGCGQLANIVN